MADQQDVPARDRFAINEWTTFRWSFGEDVYRYRQAGISTIGVWRQKITDFGEDKGRELLTDSGMSVSSLLWAGGFTGSDGRNHRESLQDAREAIELAAFLEASCLVVYSGSRGGHTLNHANRLFRQAIDSLLPVAEELSVTLAVKPMHPLCASGWTFLTDLQRAAEWSRSYDHDCLKLVLDLYQWGFDPSFGDLLGPLVPELALVQLGDGRVPPDKTPGVEQSRCPLGAGEIPLAEYLGQLTASGYSGYYELELMGEEIEALDYEPMIRQCVEVYQQWMAAPAS